MFTYLDNDICEQYIFKGRSSPVWLAEKLSFWIIFKLLKASFV